MSFRAVQSGLKSSCDFALLSHSHPRPGVSATSSAGQPLAELPPIAKSLPLVFLSLALCPLLVANSRGKNENFITDLLLLMSFTQWWGGLVFFVYLIITVFLKFMFFRIPRGCVCPNTARQQRCSLEDQNGPAAGHKIWAGCYRAEFLLA